MHSAYADGCSQGSWGQRIEPATFKFSSMDIYGRRKASAFGCVSVNTLFFASSFFFIFLLLPLPCIMAWHELDRKRFTYMH